jgi:hypothetical protein
MFINLGWEKVRYTAGKKQGNHYLTAYKYG